ncbi:MAG: transcriptional regulator, partial [Phycisphaerae bacterium]|nr:transcriptional regulator [Phycisphaerae bacterium]
FDTLVRYCAALANEGGGQMILGVTNKRPRRVVGSRAFLQPERTRRGLNDRLRLRIDFSEVQHPDGPVLIFHVPSRPVGTPVQADGIYWMRQADSLVPMSEDRLREIFAESGHDFSADVCTGATIGDLAPEAIEDFRSRWIAKSGNQALATVTREQLLSDTEALVDDRPTYAGLVLFGTQQALGRHLAQAEVIFEYRASNASGPAQQRKEFRCGFFSFYDELWNLINLRNDVQHYQEGLFVLDIPTFSEGPVREAVLNAVSHRDYQLGGSVFIRQYPRRLVVESPGGLPVGVNVENILDHQSPRNRRIADIFAKCGLVERSGQGMNLMFELSIKQSKSIPDFIGTDPYQVVLTLHGEVQDARFVQFLEKIGGEQLQSFSTADFLALDLIHREQPIPERLKPNVRRLAHLGIAEKVGRGRGTRTILSRKLYTFLGKAGVYTRKRGLDQETNNQLLLKHIYDSGEEGSPLGELAQVLPALTKAQVKYRLKLLQREGKIYLKGKGRGARWYLGKAGTPERDTP